MVRGNENVLTSLRNGRYDLAYVSFSRDALISPRGDYDAGRGGHLRFNAFSVAKRSLFAP